MAKPLKIVLGILAALILLLVGIAIALPLLFDPNDYRDEIAKDVQEATGREFSVGNIELKIFPWLRVALNDAQLGNAPGFGPEPFARMEEVGVGVHVLPLLLDRNVEISTIRLSGLNLNLQKNAEGVTNWDDLIAKQEEEKPEPKVEGEPQIDIQSIVVGGIEIDNATVSYADAQAKTHYTLSDIEFGTGELKPGDPVDLSLAFSLASAEPKANADVELTGRLLRELETNAIALRDLKLTAKGHGFNVDAVAELQAGIEANLDQQQYRVQGLTLNAELGGPPIPGGQQNVKLNSEIVYDQKAGTLRASGVQLHAVGLTLATDITGEGLNTETPKLSGPVAVATFNPRRVLQAIGQKLETADETALSEASLKAQYSGTFDSATLQDILLRLDQTNATGRLAVRDFATQATEFALKVDQIDADRYMAPKAAGEDQAPAEKKEDINEVKIPTEALEGLNVNGTLDIGSLKVNGIKMTDVELKITGPKGAPKQQQLTAKLYGGTISANTRINPGERPDYAFKTQLNALQAQPFLQDLMGRDLVSGVGNLKLDLTSSGDTIGDIRRALDGTVSLSVQDGAVKGFNLAQIVRKAQAALGGNLAYAEDGPKETDFTALSFAGRIVNGVLKSDQLDAASPLFRVAGSGEIDLVNMTVNYLAKPTVVDTSKGQGGKGLEELKGVTIPIKLTGSLSDPKYKVDFEGAVKEKAKEKLKQEYEKQEDKAKEKIREKLGEYLFGKPKQQDQQQQPQP